MQHKEDIEVKTPEADGEAAPVDWKLARSLVEPLYLDQKLYTGEPRLAHADGMAEILKGVRNDDELIVAAYLFPSRTASTMRIVGSKRRSARTFCSLCEISSS